jgi:hypothetical protein
MAEERTTQLDGYHLGEIYILSLLVQKSGIVCLEAARSIQPEAMMPMKTILRLECNTLMTISQASKLTIKMCWPLHEIELEEPAPRRVLCQPVVSVFPRMSFFLSSDPFSAISVLFTIALVFTCLLSGSLTQNFSSHCLVSYTFC